MEQNPQAAGGGGGGGVNGAPTSDQTYVIREIYETENSVENFLMQLETALQKQYKCIVIEPRKLGEETGRWILLGNILSRTALASGLASLTITLAWPSRLFVSVPLAGLAFVTQGFYDISWNYDPCSKYQVESAGSRAVAQYVADDVAVAKAATKILVYKDNYLLNYAQRTVILAAVILCGFKVYRSLK